MVTSSCVHYSVRLNRTYFLVTDIIWVFDRDILSLFDRSVKTSPYFVTPSFLPPILSSLSSPPPFPPPRAKRKRNKTVDPDKLLMLKDLAINSLLDITTHSAQAPTRRKMEKTSPARRVLNMTTPTSRWICQTMLSLWTTRPQTTSTRLRTHESVQPHVVSDRTLADCCVQGLRPQQVHLDSSTTTTETQPL